MGTELRPAILARLRAVVGDVRDDPAVLADYAGDRSPATPCPPAAVCRPKTTAEVSALVALCAGEGIAVIPRGGGTGKAGGCVPAPGSVVCSLERMTGVTRLDTGDQLVEVLPGTLTGDLRRSVAEQGWFYPPDPASLNESTVGGNVATNAGGPCCLKYGVTGDYVLGLEVVLADGRVVQPGHRSIKGVAGYDLCSLLVGSEGTLGIVTRVTARILPRPPAVRTAWLSFASAVDACEAIAALMGANIRPRTAELMDHTVLEALGRDEGAAVLLEVDGSEAGCEQQMTALMTILAKHPLQGLQLAGDEAERAALWELRRGISEAVKRPHAHHLSEDVAVPVGRVAELMRRLDVIGERAGITVAAYGHAGDGNLHVNLLTSDPDAPIVEAAEDVLRVALELGGTLTGEHGIGLLKRPYLAWEHSPALLEIQRGIKRALDPSSVLNPGKIFEAR